MLGLCGKELVNLQYNKVSNMVSNKTLFPYQHQSGLSILILTLSQTTILDSSKSKELANDNFKFDINGRKFSKQVENPAGKGEISNYKQFFLFLRCFQNTCTADT